MSERALEVRLSGVPIGMLLKNGQFEWHNDVTQRAALNSVVLSHSLPLGIQGLDAGPFFGGLLPEGRGLTQLARELQIDDRNLFGLLEVVGADVGGSVTVGEPNPPVEPIEILEPEYERILARASGYIRGGGAAGGGSAAAGVQRKVALTWRESSGTWLIGRGSTPSSHILKPVSRENSFTIRAEAYLNDIAQAIGLSRHAARVERAGEQDVLVVERYDRWKDEQGTLNRLHQEDAAQALGLPWGGDDKYENVNERANLAAIARLLPHRPGLRARPASATGAVSTEREKLLRLVVLNAVAGNTDAHAKNFSLMLPLFAGDPGHQLSSSAGRITGASTRLADAYDVVPQRFLSVDSAPLALRVGGAADAGALTAEHIVDEGVGWGLRYSRVTEIVTTTLREIISAVENVEVAVHEAPSLLPEFLTVQAKNLVRGDTAWTRTVPPAIALSPQK